MLANPRSRYVSRETYSSTDSFSHAFLFVGVLNMTAFALEPPSFLHALGPSTLMQLLQDVNPSSPS